MSKKENIFTESPGKFSLFFDLLGRKGVSFCPFFENAGARRTDVPYPFGLRTLLFSIKSIKMKWTLYSSLLLVLASSLLLVQAAPVGVETPKAQPPVVSSSLVSSSQRLKKSMSISPLNGNNNRKSPREVPDIDDDTTDDDAIDDHLGLSSHTFDWTRLKSPPFLDDNVDEEAEEEDETTLTNEGTTTPISQDKSLTGSVIIHDDDTFEKSQETLAAEVFLRMLGPQFNKADLKFMQRFSAFAHKVGNEETFEILSTMEDLLNDIVGWRQQLLVSYQESREINPEYCSQIPRKRTTEASNNDNLQLPSIRKLKIKFSEDDRRHLLWKACYNSFINRIKLAEQNIRLATRLFFELKAREKERLDLLDVQVNR